MMRKKHGNALCALLLLLCLLLVPAGCAKEEAPDATPAVQPALDAGGCVSPLRWGMSEQEAAGALAGIALETADVEGSLTVRTFQAELLGLQTDVSLQFGPVTFGDAPATDAPQVLIEIAVGFPEGTTPEQVAEPISAVLGARETHEQAAVTGAEAGGETVVEGDPLPADVYLWLADQTVGDLYGEAALEEAAGGAAQFAPYAAWSARLETVSDSGEIGGAEDGGRLVLRLNGALSALPIE